MEEQLEKHSLFSGLGDSKLLPVLWIAATIFLCYGFELFNVHLTIDEEVHARYRNAIPEWATQHRWAIYLLSFFIPSTIVPVVSVFIGLVLTVFSFWCTLPLSCNRIKI